MMFHYTNATDRLQAVRLTEGSICYFDRLVFPGDRWLFEVSPETYLEVRSLCDGEEVVVRSPLCDS
ncbi:hypothetical protein AY599_08210 [Leptolyngbya valderiana BDU 20041]|uniref:DUF1830 domain-containing protein n=1 Tax=Baaleninema simplex TaxID=2862350 RepID=UPI00034B00AD|nr:DUF1830 domain-containing protein [Baaleninema simplex]MDC0834886.1 DUF1830 domain-containing protein [Geitlerinema sp. CS-897]OAB63027.1 hypothetical protein AY599_08210 [Leptolyngbya valderiana BDU 20041]PPT05530.1 hypothetical protein CKA32_006853 [Geitlerinema sp. FC II]